MYKSNFLIIGNPTYRNQNRLLNVIIKIFNSNNNNEFILQEMDLFDIINKDIKTDRNDFNRYKKSAQRKISELNKSDIITVKKENKECYRIIKHINIENFKLKSSDLKVNEKEFMSNMLIFLLMKNNTLKLMTDLIVNVNEIWQNKYKRYRDGLLNSELVFLFYYLKRYENNVNSINLMLVVDKIIKLRLKADIYKGNKKNFYYNEVNKIITEIEKPQSIKSVEDYINTLLRTLNSTNLFSIDSYSKNSEFNINHMLCLNKSFKYKLDFFNKNSFDSFKIIIENNKFIKLLYSNFNLKKAYKGQEIITEKLFNMPENFLNYCVDSPIDWANYEYSSTIKTFNNVKENNKNKYQFFKKRFAVKVDSNGAPIGSTTAGISDCTIVFPKTVLNFEFTMIKDDYTQCNKEFIPCKKHLEKDMSLYNKKGLVFIVAPKISEGLEKEILNSNFSNKRISDNKLLMFAFNDNDYIEFIKDLSEDKLEKFFLFLWSINEKNNSCDYLKSIINNFNLNYYQKSVKYY